MQQPTEVEDGSYGDKGDHWEAKAVPLPLGPQRRPPSPGGHPGLVPKAPGVSASAAQTGEARKSPPEGPQSQGVGRDEPVAEAAPHETLGSSSNTSTPGPGALEELRATPPGGKGQAQGQVSGMEITPSRAAPGSQGEDGPLETACPPGSQPTSAALRAVAISRPRGTGQAPGEDQAVGEPLTQGKAGDSRAVQDAMSAPSGAQSSSMIPNRRFLNLC